MLLQKVQLLLSSQFTKKEGMKKLLYIFGLGLSNVLYAQTNLNPVSITATRLPQNANETGRNISVIDGAMFQQLPVRSIDELLKYVPGVEVQSRGPMGAQSDIVLRGGTYQQVLILLDGIKLNDPTTGHFNAYIPIAPAEIARIEILRGPAAATYGAEAVGGVIHVISKTFNSFTDTASMHGILKESVGQYNLFNAEAGARFTGKKVNASFGVLSNSTSGQLLRGDNRGYLHNNTVSASVAFALPKKWQLSLRSSFDNRDFAAQNFYTTFASDTATEKVSSFWNQAQLKKTTKHGSHQIDAVYKQSKDHYLYNETSIANDNTSRYAVVQYINTHKWSKNISTSAGGQISERAIRSNDRGDHNVGQAALFGTMLYSVDHWRVSGSLRGDYDGNYGFALLPQANVSYLYQNLTLRASAGKAIRSADFTERYNNYNKAKVTGGSIGNPDLEAEKSWNYEAGANLRLGKHFTFLTTAFYRHQNDVIDWTPTAYADMPRQSNLDNAGTYALAKNQNTVNTRGIEFELTYQQTLGSKHNLYANVGATFMNSKSSDSVASFYIISHAKTLVQGTIIYSYNHWNLSMNMLYKERNSQAAKGIGATITPSYFVLNARLGYQISHYWSAFISSNNLTNTQYSDLLGSKMPNAWLSIGGSFQF